MKRRMQVKREGGNWNWVNFKYERLSTFCFVCGVLGHSDKDCEVVYANPDKEVEKAYASWLRAPMRNAKVNTRARWLRNPVAKNSNITGNGGGPSFRSVVTAKTELAANFVEIGGVICEKSGDQSGIKIVGRDQGDRDRFQKQIIGREAGLKEPLEIIVDPKRRRVEDNMDHDIGLEHMTTDGLNNMITDGLVDNIEDMDGQSKNLFAEGSASQVRLAQ